MYNSLNLFSRENFFLEQIIERDSFADNLRSSTVAAVDYILL